VELAHTILALLLGCALRRQELPSLDVDHIRNVAISLWPKHGIDAWMIAAKVEDGRLPRPLSKSGKLIGDELGDWQFGLSSSRLRRRLGSNV
jgi:hypothetical protein